MQLKSSIKKTPSLHKCIYVLYMILGSKGDTFMLVLFTCEIFFKWHKEMDTTCFPAVLFWLKLLKTLHGNEFCLSLMKTLIFTEGSRQWQGTNSLFVITFLISRQFTFSGWMSFSFSSVNAKSTQMLLGWHSLLNTPHGNGCDLS